MTGWRSLLQGAPECMVLPWIGGAHVQHRSRRWRLLRHASPQGHGWHEFELTGTWARCVRRATGGHHEVGYEGGCGYLVGDLFVADEEGGDVRDPRELAGRFPRVHLIEPGLDHFDRVAVRRFWDEGPLFYVGREFPVGAEAEVLDAFVERKESVAGISGVSPALDLAFRMKSWYRADVERRRAEAQARREREERRRQITERLGDGALRREVAKQDFEAAAKAALALGGAQYLEHRAAPARGEYIVRYRLDERRFECVCTESLNIVDSGICLTDEDTGEKGDTYFTLESLPGVVREGLREGASIWRHV